MDSEWHSFFECSLIHSPRREFILLTQQESIFENGSSVEILHCLFPASVKIKDWLLLLLDLRSKSGSIVNIGFGSSRLKP